MDKQQIVAIVEKETQAVVMKKVAVNQELLSTRLLDSMGLVDVTMGLEMAFNIKIDARDVIPQNFETIDNIADYVARSLNG
jgi:acyl carrier protein